MRAGPSVIAVVVLVALVAPGSAAQPVPPSGPMLHVFGTVFVGPEGTDQVNVTPGETVVVMNILVDNVTPAAHTVTSDDGRSFDVTVGPPDPQVGYTFVTFDAPKVPASYPFHSKLDAGMHGVLKVVGAAQSPGVAAIGALVALTVACAASRRPPRR